MLVILTNIIITPAGNFVKQNIIVKKSAAFINTAVNENSLL
ncbi:hypothetical protein [Pectinatus frisingensis]|nr:hypothetical protein [Pectinatus frisingensis]